MINVPGYAELRLFVQDGLTPAPATLLVCYEADTRFNPQSASLPLAVSLPVRPSELARLFEVLREVPGEQKVEEIVLYLPQDDRISIDDVWSGKKFSLDTLTELNYLAHCLGQLNEIGREKFALWSKSEHPTSKECLSAISQLGSIQTVEFSAHDECNFSLSPEENLGEWFLEHVAKDHLDLVPVVSLTDWDMNLMYYLDTKKIGTDLVDCNEWTVSELGAIKGEIDTTRLVEIPPEFLPAVQQHESFQAKTGRATAAAKSKATGANPTQHKVKER
jgi:hypothetical protein